MSHQSLTADNTQSFPATDNLSRAIVGLSLALASLIVVGLLAFGGPGFRETVPLVQLPWVQPVAQSFMLLSAFAIAFLCLGRYRAIGGAWVFWSGLAFLENGILGIFYLLSWPGLLGDHGVIAQLSNTASWLGMLTFSFIALLLASVNARQPESLKRSHSFPAYVMAGVLFALVGVLSVLFENGLPVMIVGATFSPLSLVWEGILVFLAAVAAASACRRNYRDEDAMFGYVALFLIMMAFALLISILGGKRYDFWWYTGRLLFVPAYLIVLIGFLQEGYSLFGREREYAEGNQRLLQQVREQNKELQAQREELLETRALTEQRAREAEDGRRILQGLIRQIPEGMIIADAPDLHLRIVSDYVLETIGMTQDELQAFLSRIPGQPWGMLWPDGSPVKAEDAPLVRAIVQGETTIGREAVIQRPDGSRVYILINAVPIRDQAGNIVAGIAVWQDITERKRAEGLLANQAQELADSVAELEQFAYVASHDLQEPLRMVTSYVQLLARHYQGQLDADADEFIGYAVDGAKRMQQLIDDLLTYSRVGTRGKPFEPVDCEKILAETLSNLRVAIEESGTVVAHDHLPTVMADPTHLGQLFQNLIGNAIKFRGEAPARVYVSAERGGGEWVFSIRDNGIGISPEYFDRIFMIFQRLHTRKDYPGTGIGLAVCKKIVERHGGRIWVESEPRNGSIFYFAIPERGLSRD